MAEEQGSRRGKASRSRGPEKRQHLRGVLVPLLDLGRRDRCRYKVGSTGLE